MTAWSRLCLEFDQLAFREKALVTLALFGGIWLLSWRFFLVPIWDDWQASQYPIAQQKTLFQDLNTELTRLQSDLDELAPSYLDQSIAQQKMAHEQLDNALASYVNRVVNANDMATWLGTVLDKSKKLTLLSLTTQAAQPLLHDSIATGYFMHPISVRFRGKYFDVARYLAELETLPQQYYWKQLAYRVVDYPWAEVTLDVYTLGEYQDFMRSE